MIATRSMEGQNGAGFSRNDVANFQSGRVGQHQLVTAQMPKTTLGSNLPPRMRFSVFLMIAMRRRSKQLSEREYVADFLAILCRGWWRKCALYTDFRRNDVIYLQVWTETECTRAKILWLSEYPLYGRQRNLPLAGSRPCLFRTPDFFFHRSSLPLCCTSESHHKWCRSKSITRTSTKAMATPKIWCCAWSKPMRYTYTYACNDALYYCIQLCNDWVRNISSLDLSQ